MPRTLHAAIAWGATFRTFDLPSLPFSRIWASPSLCPAWRLIVMGAIGCDTAPDSWPLARPGPQTLSNNRSARPAFLHLNNSHGPVNTASQQKISGGYDLSMAGRVLPVNATIVPVTSWNTSGPSVRGADRRQGARPAVRSI